MTQERPRIVFCTNTNRIIDFVRDGAGETDIQAIARLKGEYGTALTTLPAQEAQVRYENSFKTPVQEITAEAFDDALNVLPPEDWRRGRGAESFKCMERIAGAVTSIYVAVANRYFTFNDHIRTPHDQCCERVMAFIAAHPVPTATAPEAST